MALGRRRDEQQAMWVSTTDLARSPGHPFYDALNRLLRDGDFDRRFEALCEPYYAKCGRPSIPPGTSYRILFIAYFEGIDSQRGIAWRWADSLSLRDFLGIAARARTPDHSTLTLIRQRLPVAVDEQVFKIDDRPGTGFSFSAFSPLPRRRPPGGVAARTSPRGRARRVRCGAEKLKS